ncbi:hypothetical protein Rfer_2165 [Rhodoferax ferrireducens T118]|uniref:Uncharacterized protein n=1 Tax=Albidiferax ferrireducens (strain ATCC BAA-621 / DSM 15236 / T118) TaxID=338969 RepID=Q21WG4_ALBFT|nr:hypothetical protein Rfer_2165 [Rhodoferax ferrireducens T118]
MHLIKDNEGVALVLSGEINKTSLEPFGALFFLGHHSHDDDEGHQRRRTGVSRRLGDVITQGPAHRQRRHHRPDRS